MKKQGLVYTPDIVICNMPKKSKHCLKNCRHGRPHTKDTERANNCTKPEFCSLGSTGIRKVFCKPLNKKQQKEWMKKNESR